MQRIHDLIKENINENVGINYLPNVSNAIVIQENNSNTSSTFGGKKRYLGNITVKVFNLKQAEAIKQANQIYELLENDKEIKNRFYQITTPISGGITESKQFIQNVNLDLIKYF